ncbi:MAG: UPF0323 family lipoprotein [Campylobacter sp.]|nr:UPF0323 family lipoprotein [Campylobacter sp.]
MKKYINKFKKIATYSLAGGFGLVLAGSLAGCGNNNSNDTQMTQNAMQGAFVKIEETSPGVYKVLEEVPSETTTVILKDINGTERILSDAEIDELLKKENEKIDNGTSNLTNEARMSSGGLSLGEAILASAAGALLGSWIGSKLFNNQAFNSQRQNAYKNPSAYSRSVNSFNQAKQGATTKKTSSGRSGFFGGGSKSSSVGG